MSRRTEDAAHPESSVVAHWLIHHAARRAPEFLSSRLEEEWLADLEHRNSTVSRLCFAAGCCWAVIVIVSDHPRREVSELSPATTSRGYISLAHQNFSYFSLRSATLFLIVGIHGALFGGLITTLAHARILTTPIEIQDRLSQAVPPDVDPVRPYIGLDGASPR